MNFLSSGNQFTEIILDKSKSTLVVGENGAGKSTILDALSFALYGKAFRNINKPQLINSITGKNCVVECEFDVGGKQYLIRRGMKPYFFEIFQNNKLINQDSRITEYQDVLEKSILKLTHKSFSQIVVLGSANFIPFMQLSPYVRREVIEDLLDIQIFSTMNSLLKSKIDENKSDIATVENSIMLLENQIELQKKHVNSIKQNNDDIVDKKRQSIQTIQTYIQEANVELSTLKEELDKYIESVIDERQVQKKLSKSLEFDKQIDDKLKTTKKELKFYQDNDNCPTCHQALEEEFKKKKIEKKNTQIDKLVDGSSKLEQEITSINNRISEIKKTQKHIDHINKQISTLNNKIFSWNESVTLLNSEIESVRNNTKIIDGTKDEIKKLKEKLKSEMKFKEQLYDKRNIINISGYLLKDNGVKTRIIKQYVPIMNKLINKYLSALDFFIQFELNEKFEETIKSRYRDEFSYNSFSEGEKMRVDLALLFTWRAIAKMRNSASTNLLIMDEVFDSSLDNNGTEEFMKILENLTSDVNVFVISHKADGLYDKFHSVIKFKKEKNFSKMELRA
jgi:DNA repair exonuclease SbcCD ATPase subunit